MGFSRRTWWLAVALAGALALALVQAALAEPPIVRLTAGDQAAAKRALIKLGDLAEGWTRVPTNTNPADDGACPLHEPKLSDLVVTGAADARFRAQPLLLVWSSVRVMQTPSMAELHWRRTVLDPGVLTCLRASEPGSTTISVKRLPFPKLAPRTARIRTVFDVSGTYGTARMATDVIVLGRGRTELRLGIGALYRHRGDLEEFEVRLAKLMLSRTPA